MPLVRAVTGERDALLGFLAAQRAGVTNALRGLTDEQAAATPTASALSGLLADYAAAAGRTDELAAAADLDTPANLPNSPRTIRWVLLHLIEETARHAGHADVIRESIDGATAHTLAEPTG